jgi:hypothetical protein
MKQQTVLEACRANAFRQPGPTGLAQGAVQNKSKNQGQWSAQLSAQSQKPDPVPSPKPVPLPDLCRDDPEGGQEVRAQSRRQGLPDFNL